MIVAGEASGDLHGSYLMRAMKELLMPVTFYGIGGENMVQEGMHFLARSSQLSVMGLTEVFSHLRFIVKLMTKLKKSLDTNPPDLLILIDYPGFNLHLAKAAKKRGVKVLYYISPKIWAWRKGRIKTIRQAVDQMALIFPFEEDIYRKAGVKATFVGHPLLDEINLKKPVEMIFSELQLEKHKTTVALLPGSREGEVKKLLPGMLDAAELIAARIPDIQFIIPTAQTIRPELINKIVKQVELPIHLVSGLTYEVLAVSDVVIVASGTATLETALFGKPMVIVYKVSPLTYILGRMVVKIKHVGLPNIVAGHTIVPELIQHHFTPERLAEEVISILSNHQIRDRMVTDLSAIKRNLGAPGASLRTAQLACSMLS
jgi:lipid-A-disaccharide synthase